MKEEIDHALSTLEEMKESDDISFIEDRANIVKTLMESVELSCVACGLAESDDSDEIEAWDLEEEYEDEDVEEEE